VIGGGIMLLSVLISLLAGDKREVSGEVSLTSEKIKSTEQNLVLAGLFVGIAG
jgi:hypothetical protein